jgi:hypothetical protein
VVERVEHWEAPAAAASPGRGVSATDARDLMVEPPYRSRVSSLDEDVRPPVPPPPPPPQEGAGRWHAPSLLGLSEPDRLALRAVDLPPYGAH